MLATLVERRSLSPLLPLNNTLAKMSHSDFNDAMNGWTEKARGAPYVDHVMYLEEAYIATV